MPRTVRQPLTDLGVQGLKVPGHYAAGGQAHGLLLQVSPTGKKSWIARLTCGTRVNEAGRVVQRRIDFGLGAYPLVSLKAARERAREYRELVLRGVDPLAANVGGRNLDAILPSGRTSR
jgi:hypothetical protein